jgi:large subunit ribosomal protein L35
MPKMKTNKAAAKRFKLTGSGKLKRSRAFTSHMFSNKTQKQKRKLRKAQIMTPGDFRRTKRMLGL